MLEYVDAFIYLVGMDEMFNESSKFDKADLYELLNESS